MPFWTELSETDLLREEFINIYKDLVGVKPRFGTEDEWNSKEWLEDQIRTTIKAYAE
jgi:hypothetical protein